MSGLEDRLSLDITEALSAVARIEDAFVSAGQAFQKSIEEALGSLNVQGDVVVPVEADATDVTGTIDEAVANADTQLELFADAEPITKSIDDAVDAADATVPVDADVSEAREAINALSGEDVEVGVNIDTGQAEEALAGLGTASTHAGEGAEHASGQFQGLGVAAGLAAGEVGAAKEALHLAGAAGATAAAGIGAVVVVGKELFDAALDARSAQERFNLVLGEFGEEVEHIDVGGLNDELGEFATRLGATGREIENAASKIFQLGTANGTAGPKIAETTKQVIALAGRAVALNPALGNVGEVAERALTGLARGGRFAANLGLALTASEISARALVDTGKTLTSQLTIYDKAAAGAAIATERLGDSLGTDINAGAENVQIKLNSIKARFEEFLESAGQPILDPVIDSIERAEPVIEGLAQVFADILPPVVGIAGAFADSLVPALEGLQGPAELVGTVLNGASEALAAIPGPVKTVAAAIAVLTLGLQRFAPAAIEAGIASGSIGSGFLAAASGLLPLTGAIAGSVAVIGLVKNQVKSTDENVQAFLDSWIELLGRAPDIETFEEGLAGVAEQANKTGEAANEMDDAWNRVFNAGDLRAQREAATGLRSILDVATPVVDKAKELQHEFGLSSGAALQLALRGDEAIESFEAQAKSLEDLTTTEREAARATDEFWLAAQSGALTAADIQERAALLGTTFEDLAKEVSDARQPIIDFANEVIGGFIGVDTALSGLKENAGFHDFLAQMETDLANAAAFTGNLQTLIDRGATTLAQTIADIAKSDPAKAAAFAKQLVDESAQTLASDESRAKAAKAGEVWVAGATQNVADELSGGLELAVKQAQDAASDKFLKMPGQLESSTTVAGQNIAADLVDSISDSPALAAFPDDMEEIGRQGIIGFKNGISGDELIAVKIAADNAVNVVLGAFRKGFKTGSPSKVMIEIGQDVARGFFDGLADLEGAAKAIDPVLDVVDKFHLNAAQIAGAAGSSIDEITKSLTDLGEAEKKITPDELLDIGKAVKAIGGTKGVKELQDALAKQVSAAFGGLGGKEISDIISALNTRAALQRTSDIFGVTPVIPEAGKTTVVKGQDATATNIENLNVTVTPPPEGTAAEIAGAIAVQTAWAIQGVSA